MMRVLLVVAFIFLSACLKAQESLPDTVFTSEQVVRIAEVMDSLENRIAYLENVNRVNEELLSKYKVNSEDLNSLLLSYEKYSYIQEAQIELFDLNLKRYQEFIKAEKRPWYDKPVLWTIVGAGTMYMASAIVANVK